MEYTQKLTLINTPIIKTMFVKTLFILAITIVFANCSNPQPETKVQTKDSITKAPTDTVRKPTKSADKITDKSAPVKTTTTVNNSTVHVVYKNDYCGGAAPSKEILDNFKTEYPLSNSTIMLQNTIAGSQPFRVNTNNEGIISAPLDAGTYNYYMTENYSKTTGISFSSSCKIWLARCFGQVTIIAGQTGGYKILFNFGCNPCEPPRP